MIPHEQVWYQIPQQLLKNQYLTNFPFLVSKVQFSGTKLRFCSKLSNIAQSATTIGVQNGLERSSISADTTRLLTLISQPEVKGTNAVILNEGMDTLVLENDVKDNNGTRWY